MEWLIGAASLSAEANQREGRPPKDNATKTNHSLRLGVESQQRIGVVVAAALSLFNQSNGMKIDWLCCPFTPSKAWVAGGWLYVFTPATTHSSFLFD